MSPVIGLTGPIGCGKSTVAARLAVHGGHVIDADALARLVTGPGRGTLKAMRERFGDAVFDDRGELDRGALSAVAFDDPAALRDLEAIRLVEGGLASRCDEIWLVVCDRPTQRDRLRGRGMDPDDAERRIASQGDMAERLAPAATRILRTDGPLDAVLVSIDAALREALGGAPRNP